MNKHNPASEYFSQKEITRQLSAGRIDTDAARWNGKSERAIIIITLILAAFCVALAALDNQEAGNVGSNEVCLDK